MWMLWKNRLSRKLNVEADIDISEIADIAEGAEEAAELIAALL